MNSTNTGQEAATGSGVLILLAILLVSVLLFTTRHSSQQEAIAPEAEPAPTPAIEQITVSQETFEPATNALTQTAHGQQVGYTLKLPAGWTTQSVAMDGVDNLSASCSNLNVAVVVQESKLSTSSEATADALSSLKASATEFFSSKPEKIVLDGRPWVKFVVKCRIEQTSMGYQYYVYSGVEGTYQIVAWTELPNFERDLRLMRTIMHTFRFPQSSEHRADTADPSGAITVSTRGAVP